MKIDTSMTGKPVKYITILFISLALFGVIIPFVTSEKHFVDALGFGIIMVSCFGGMGMAFFVRRRDAIKIKKQIDKCPKCRTPRQNGKCGECGYEI